MPDRPAPAGLIQSFDSSGHLIRPSGRLESEGDGSSRLPVRAARHRCVAVSAREPHGRPLDPDEVGPDNRTGITHRNAAQVVAAGADAVAVISDLFDAPDIAERIEQFNSIFATHTALVADADAGV